MTDTTETETDTAGENPRTDTNTGTGETGADTTASAATTDDPLHGYGRDMDRLTQVVPALVDRYVDGKTYIKSSNLSPHVDEMSRREIGQVLGGFEQLDVIKLWGENTRSATWKFPHDFAMRLAMSPVPVGTGDLERALIAEDSDGDVRPTTDD